MLHLRYPKPKPKLGLLSWSCRKCHKRLDPDVLALVILQGGEVPYGNRELWFHPGCVLSTLGWDEPTLRSFMIASVVDTGD